MTATFPQVPLDVHVEMKLGGAWTQVQASPHGVRGADEIKIVRGRADEQQSSSQQPSTCDLSLNNRDGRYSPRNPNSPYYGQLGRNTPIRVSTIGDGSVFARIPGNYGVDNVTTPDNSALHITGDIDIRVDVTLDNWLQYQTLAGRYVNGGPGNSWILYIGYGGDLRFAWTPDGTVTNEKVVSATTNLNQAPRTQLAVRVTLQASTGTVTFYTAPNISGSWTQLGSTVVVGSTSINAGALPLTLGENGDEARTLLISIMAGRLNAAQVLNGIGGTAVANPVFTSQSVGTTSFTDAAGLVWTLNGDTEITNRWYRFSGEVSSFPPVWDISGGDVYVPIEAAGILRRYGQGSSLVTSPIRRAVTVATTQPVIYWPCEDPSGSGAFAVGAGSGQAQAMLIAGTPSLASDTHIGGSAALPTLSNSTWTAGVPSYTKPSPDQVQFVFVLYLNSAPANDAIIGRFTVGSTRFDVGYTTASPGGLYCNTYDASSGSLIGSDNSGTALEPVSTGTAYTVGLQAIQSGANFSWELEVWTGSTISSGAGATVTSRTLGSATQIVINPNGTLTDTVVGHIAVYDNVQSAFLASTPPQATSLTGNAGETAGSRFIRLCMENGIQPRTVGDASTSPAMGPQGSDTFLNLLQACVDADYGLMYEPRDVLGLGMKMRSSLYSQPAQATLSITASQLSAVPAPIEDDQLIRNDVTVTRTNGSFARAALTTGTLSIQSPPNGVGPGYTDTPTVNYELDSQLLNAASWRLHAQTVDEARWPVITTGMHTSELVASPTLAHALQQGDVGDVLDITGMPSWMPPDDTRQLVQGLAETMSNFFWEIAFNCSPASPYDVVVLDDSTYGRPDTDGSTLQTGVNATATSFSVATTTAGSPLWTTNAADWPFDVIIDGERVTVTAVSGSSSPQTFTVTRSVNGISKSHSSGASISLFRPIYLAW